MNKKSNLISPIVLRELYSLSINAKLLLLYKFGSNVDPTATNEKINKELFNKLTDN